VFRRSGYDVSVSHVIGGADELPAPSSSPLRTGSLPAAEGVSRSRGAGIIEAIAGPRVAQRDDGARCCVLDCLSVSGAASQRQRRCCDQGKSLRR
jgi:hypothetical protein